MKRWTGEFFLLLPAAVALVIFTCVMNCQMKVKMSINQRCTCDCPRLGVVRVSQRGDPANHHVSTLLGGKKPEGTSLTCCCVDGQVSPLPFSRSSTRNATVERVERVRLVV